MVGSRAAAPTTNVNSRRRSGCSGRAFLRHRETRACLPAFPFASSYSCTVWRADRRMGDEVNLADTVPVHPLSNSTSPVSVSTGDGRVPSVNVAEPVWETWREQIAALGGPSPLLHFDDSPRVRIELSTTHPGGLAQFITGKTTLLSSLIRDDLAFRSASVAASNITAKGVELSATRGIDSIQLGIGIAEWSTTKKEYRAPILLRPIALRRYGRDFELRLKGAPYLNPALARALREQFGVTLDADAFVALATSRRLVQAAAGHRPAARPHQSARLVQRAAAAGRLLVRRGLAPRCWRDADEARAPGARRARRQPDRALVDRRGLRGRRPRPPGSASSRHRHPAARRRLRAGERGRPDRRRQLPRRQDAAGHGRHADHRERARRLVAQHKRVLVVSPRRASLRAVSTRLGRHRAAGHRRLAAHGAPRRHPGDQPQREGQPAQRRRGRRRPRAPAQRAARLPRGARSAATPCSASRCARCAGRARPPVAAAQPSARPPRGSTPPRHRALSPAIAMPPQRP